MATPQEKHASWLCNLLLDYELSHDQERTAGDGTLSIGNPVLSDAVLITAERNKVYIRRSYLAVLPEIAKILPVPEDDSHTVLVFPEFGLDQIRQLANFLRSGAFIFNSVNKLSEFKSLLHCLGIRPSDDSLTIWDSAGTKLDAADLEAEGSRNQYIQEPLTSRDPETKPSTNSAKSPAAASPGGKETFPCYYCDKKFNLKIKLTMHMKKCSSKRSLWIDLQQAREKALKPCPICDDFNVDLHHVFFKHKAVYQEYERSVTQPFVCECKPDKRFPSAKYLLTHRIKCDETVLRPFLDSIYLADLKPFEVTEDSSDEQTDVDTEEEEPPADDTPPATPRRGEVKSTHVISPTRKSALLPDVPSRNYFKCSKCHVLLKRDMIYTHVCRPEDDDISIQLNLNPSLSQKATLACTLCDGEKPVFIDAEALKLHYIFGHSNSFFQKNIKGYTAGKPWKCTIAPQNCTKVLASWKDIVLHAGIHHEKLFQALKHNKAYDMTNVLKRLFPDKYARWHKLSSIKGDLKRKSRDDGSRSSSGVPNTVESPTGEEKAGATQVAKGILPIVQREEILVGDNVRLNDLHQDIQIDQAGLSDQSRSRQGSGPGEGGGSGSGVGVGVAHSPIKRRRHSQDSATLSDTSTTSPDNASRIRIIGRPDGTYVCPLCPDSENMFFSGEEYVYHHLAHQHFQEHIEQRFPMQAEQDPVDGRYDFYCLVDECKELFYNKIARIKHIGYDHELVHECLRDSRLVTEAKRKAGRRDLPFITAGAPPRLRAPTPFPEETPPTTPPSGSSEGSHAGSTNRRSSVDDDRTCRRCGVEQVTKELLRLHDCSSKFNAPALDPQQRPRPISFAEDDDVTDKLPSRPKKRRKSQETQPVRLQHSSIAADGKKKKNDDQTKPTVSTQQPAFMRLEDLSEGEDSSDIDFNAADECDLEIQKIEDEDIDEDGDVSMLLSAEDLLDTKDRPTSREATVLNRDLSRDPSHSLLAANSKQEDPLKPSLSAKSSVTPWEPAKRTVSPASSCDSPVPPSSETESKRPTSSKASATSHKSKSSKPALSSYLQHRARAAIEAERKSMESRSSNKSRSSSGGEELECSLCKKSFTSKITLKRHKECSTCKNKCVLHETCQYCRVCFNKGEFHRKCQAYKCNEKCFTSSVSYQKHAKTHSLTDLL